MERTELLAEYVTDEGQTVRIVARMTTRLGKVESPKDDDGLDHFGKYQASSIRVLADGRLVEEIALTKELARFSQRDTNELLGEINALKDCHADADEVVGELHSLLG